MKILKVIARRILRAELQGLEGKIDNLEGRVHRADQFFSQWRSSSFLWERYAQTLKEQLPFAPTFEEFFWALPVEEAKNPKRYDA